MRATPLPTALALMLWGGLSQAQPVYEPGYGPDPELPPPRTALLPTVEIAPARGWAEDQTPTPAPGLKVTPFATGLDHPRWLLALPNGDVLVAESNAPERPARKGPKIWAMNKVMEKAGAGVPSANRISLLRDADGDGIAELREPYIEGLNSPFGMALVGDQLYVANTDAVVVFPYDPEATRITAAPRQVVTLPAGDLNHHWTKGLIASPDGRRLYATVGSNSNIAEHGMAAEEGRAAIWEIDPRAGSRRLFASGLRNPNGLAWEPASGELWTTVNERDELGDELVPDYLTRVVEGGFYGWPYSYFGQNVDERVEPPRPDLVSRAIKPDYGLGAHTAALGLAWSGSNTLPEQFRDGMFIGQHGSWNREPLSGYRVIFVPFRDGEPAGPPVEVLGGFLNEENEAMGRPVGVAIDQRGGLLVADDVGNSVWRVTSE